MKTFIDSNVFIYSFLNQGVGKKQVAARLLAQAIRDGNGYISLQVVKESVRRALEIKSQYGIQFYDALMVAAAEASGCGEILTEDLNDGQIYCGVKAVNPFK